MSALLPGAAPPPEQVHALVRESIPEFLDIVGLGQSRRGRPLWSWLFSPAATRFARQIATYDQIVGTYGLQQGARWLLGRFTARLDVVGRAAVPATGPLLIVANHPGLTDAAALLASLPRPDLYVVAIDRPFLRALPHTSEHLIYVPPEGAGRRRILHTVAGHLDRGHAVLMFPAGRLEPDPLVEPGSEQSLRTWSRSIGLLVERTPDARMLPTVVSGVRSPHAFAHPLTRLRRRPQDQQRLAALLQTLVPLYHRVCVRVTFGTPIAAGSLLATHGSAPAITRAITEQMCGLLQRRPVVRSPRVAQGSLARRTKLVHQL